jgi:hypothetical protein
MAKKSKHVKDLSDQEVADAFIHYETQQHAAVYEMFCVAARLLEPLIADVRRGMERMEDESRWPDLQLGHTAQQLATAAGMRDLLNATVKRYAFANPFGDDDFDPDGSRSVAVAELILQHAAEANRKYEED